MFYAHFVLAKKGPLARIWLAAHWDKKLTKAHVFETNIESSVEGILQPKVKMALRTSGHLLLGIVRIYSRKAKYLLADCNEAFIKIKIAFRPGVVDLPEGNREAAVAAITLPEVFHDFDTAMPDITIDMDAQVSLNQSRAEDITLKEDYGNMCLIADDGFDDLGFDEPEAARDASNIEDFDQATLLLGGDTQTDIPTEEAAAQPNTSSNSVIPHKASISLDAPLRDDGFGGTIGEGLLDGETGALFEPAGLFDDAPLGPEPVEQPPCNIDEQPSTSDKEPQQPIEKPVEETQEDDSDDDMYDMAPGSIGAPSPPSSPESPVQPPESAETESQAIDGPSSEPGGELKMAVPEPPVSPPVQDNVENNVPDMPPPSIPPLAALEHTTLINNDAESFALAPLDATIVHGAERTVKTKRKRKLIVDEVKSISGEEMKTQLSDTTDIVATLDLAPPTKRLMHWKETGGVEKLFALPGHPILSKTLSRGYARHLTTRSVDNEDFFKDDSEEEIGDMSEVEKGRVEGTDGPRKKRRISDQLSTNEISPLDPLRLERQVHLDNTRSSYANEPGLPHTSLDVSNYYEPQHSLYSDSAQQMANQQQMMNNMHQASQDHMMQQMHFNDLQQMPHIPPIIDSIVQGPSLDSLGSVIPDVSLPPEAIPHSIQQVDMMQNHLQQSYQGAQSLLDINQQSFQEQLPTPLPPPPANLSLENSHIEVSGSRQKVPNLMTDDEATQICAEDQYPQPQPTAIDVVPQNHTENGNPVVSQTGNPPVPETAVIQNPGVSQAENHIASNPETDTNDLFDTLIGDLQQQQPSQQVNHLPEEDGLQQNKNNEYPLSDDDDYGAPASVGPVVPDEQMADETYEQFEERILTKRTTHLLHVIHNRLETHQKVSFGDLVKNNKRKQVAQKFYTFLVLKKQQAVELDQDSTYGDLTITKGPKYNLVYNGN